MPQNQALALINHSLSNSLADLEVSLAELRALRTVNDTLLERCAARLKRRGIDIEKLTITKPVERANSESDFLSKSGPRRLELPMPETQIQSTQPFILKPTVTLPDVDFSACAKLVVWGFPIHPRLNPHEETTNILRLLECSSSVPAAYYTAYRGTRILHGAPMLYIQIASEAMATIILKAFCQYKYAFKDRKPTFWIRREMDYEGRMKDKRTQNVVEFGRRMGWDYRKRDGGQIDVYDKQQNRVTRLEWEEVQRLEGLITRAEEWNLAEKTPQQLKEMVSEFSVEMHGRGGEGGHPVVLNVAKPQEPLAAGSSSEDEQMKDASDSSRERKSMAKSPQSLYDADTSELTTPAKSNTGRPQTSYSVNALAERFTPNGSADCNNIPLPVIVEEEGEPTSKPMKQRFNLRPIRVARPSIRSGRNFTENLVTTNSPRSPYGKDAYSTVSESAFTPKQYTGYLAKGKSQAASEQDADDLLLSDGEIF